MMNRNTLQFKETLETYDANQQAEISAQLFLEYCINQDQCENTRRLAPLINTVAEALTKDIDDRGDLKAGIKAVQMYLRTPPVEYFGETLVRLSFLDKKSVDEMLEIQPVNKIFGTFLVEQGLISEEQRDIAVIAQKRLFSIQEVHSRVVNPEHKDMEKEIIDNLKNIFQHFMISTSEIEKELNHANIENIPCALERLENIITETERTTNSVLEIVDELFNLEEEMRAYLTEIKDCCNSDKNLVTENTKVLMDKLDFIKTLSLSLNSTQQIQDRVGQQLLKIMPTIQAFQDQIYKIARKLKLNWQSPLTKETENKMGGYENGNGDNRIAQDDVDDLLSSLGL